MESLEQEIEALYTQNGFGKVLKSVIDEAVFHHLLYKNLTALGNGLVENGNINYFRVNKTVINTLAGMLKTTEPTVNRYLEAGYQLRGQRIPKTEMARMLLEIILSGGITKNTIQDGMFYCNVANPVVKNFLQTKLFESGGIADFLKNSEIMVIGLWDFFRMLDFTDDAAMKREIRDALTSAMKNAAQSKEAGDFLAEFEQKPISEQLITVAKGGAGVLLEKYLGGPGSQAAMSLLKKLFGFVQKRI